jgi:hypothetical protein
MQMRSAAGHKIVPVTDTISFHNSDMETGYVLKGMWKIKETYLMKSLL